MVLAAAAKDHTLFPDTVGLALKDLVVELVHHMVVILITIHRQVVVEEQALKVLRVMQVDHFHQHNVVAMVV